MEFLPFLKDIANTEIVNILSKACVITFNRSTQDFLSSIVLCFVE